MLLPCRHFDSCFPLTAGPAPEYNAGSLADARESKNPEMIGFAWVLPPRWVRLYSTGERFACPKASTMDSCPGFSLSIFATIPKIITATILKSYEGIYGGVPM